MCLAECPTYRLEDQRERIAARAPGSDRGTDRRGVLTATRPLIAHLDNCLGCRRCERVCPSAGALRLSDRRGPCTCSSGKQGSRWASLIQNRSLLRWGRGSRKPCQRRFQVRCGGMHRLHEMARALGRYCTAPTPGDYPAPKTAAAAVSACSSAAPVRRSRAGHCRRHCDCCTMQVTASPYPAQAGCCGALAQHSGDPADGGEAGRRQPALPSTAAWMPWSVSPAAAATISTPIDRR